MALLEWRDEYSVGIRFLDEEHRHLINIINSLHAAMKNRTSQRAMEEILSALEDYAATHFLHEEELMTVHSYPALTSHRRQHQRFVSSLNAFQRDLAESTSISVKVFNFLSQWLRQHIMSQDKLYSSYLTKRGAT